MQPVQNAATHPHLGQLIFVKFFLEIGKAVVRDDNPEGILHFLVKILRHLRVCDQIVG